MKYLNAGLTLIELVAFIVIIGIAGTLIIPLTNSLKNSSSSNSQIRAMQLGRGRMELILASKYLLGFDNMADPCASSSTGACAAVPGYTITPTITSGWNGSTNYKQVTVTVSGAGSITLQSLVSNMG